MTTFHDARVPYLFPKAGRLRASAVRLLARTSHAVIAADERDLVALGGPARTFHQVPIGSNLPCVPPSGYDRASFRTGLGIQSDDLVVAYFGLLNASKGLDLLFDAFALVTRTRPNARLWLLGGEVGASDPTDRATAARVRGRIDDRVMETGWLAPSNLSAHVLAADVALLPYLDGASARRGSLLACAEHELPIVSTRPASESVADSIEAVDRTPDALARAVLAIADDNVAATRLRDASRALAERTSWPRIADAHVAIYESLNV